MRRANESRWLDTEDSGNTGGDERPNQAGRVLELGQETVGMGQDLEILVDWEC